MTSTAELLADRYGRRVSSSKSKKRTWIVVTAAVLLAAFIVWAIAAVSAPKTNVSVVSSKFKVVNERNFAVTGKISRTAQGPVTCAVKVQALDFGVVGYREVNLASNETTFKTNVFATRPAVNASVARCWLR
jgi:hypothetical protein